MENGFWHYFFNDYLLSPPNTLTWCVLVALALYRLEIQLERIYYAIKEK